MNNSVPPLETGYREYRGLLYAALGRMALQGFVVPPNDANDLVHDFFVDAWGGLERRYEPARASVSTYVYAAFVRFARPRIVRLHRFNRTLRDPAEITRLGDVIWEPTQAIEVSSDLELVHESVLNLPDVLQEALELWLDADKNSERDIAKDLGVSRYELRRRLIDALGRLTVAIGGLSEVSQLDRDVANAVWHCGLTIGEAAGQLGLPYQQVKNACLRNQHLVQQSLTRVRHVSPKRHRRATMTSLDTLIKLVRDRTSVTDTLFAPDPDVGKLLFNVGTIVDEHSEQWESLSLEDKALIYLDISRQLGVDEKKSDVVDALTFAYANDQEDVGRAFADALAPALPDIASLSQLANALAPVIKPLSPNAKSKFLEQLDVRAAGEEILAPISAYGVRPTHIVQATDAIALLLQRAIEVGFFPRQGELSVVLDGPGVRQIRGGDNTLARSELTNEVATMIDLPADAASPILYWMMMAAPSVRSLIAGFSATYNNNGVTLLPDVTADNLDLYQRWSPT